MSDELFETFDAEGNVVGIAPRSRVHREGLWHRAANVFLFRSDGRLLIQRRQWSKDVCPGAWDLSVAEHLKPGETYAEGAARGLREELGVEHVALEPVGSVTRARLDLAGNQVKDYELQQSFRGLFDGEVQPNVGEVHEIDAVSLDDLSVAFRERPQEFTPWFRETATRLGFCGAS
jgi:isopentenyl-diphosphate delta-isomerase type 1